MAFSSQVGFAMSMALAVGVVGCSSSSLQSDDVAESTSALTAHQAERSYVGTAVLDALAAYPALEGRVWNASTDNTFDSDFLWTTPVSVAHDATTSLALPAACTDHCDADFGLRECRTSDDCSGGGTCAELAAAGKRLCVGHSDALVDEIYDTLVSAETFVDVTSLQPPDGRFEAAVRNAITVLSKKPNPPRVRLLFGAYPLPGGLDTKAVLARLTRDVAPTSAIEVAVGGLRSSNSPFSWNHAKMVVIDGKRALVGGHNMWTHHYLEVDPVHDLSMRVRGSAAGDAHHFANELWDYVCTTESALTRFTGSVTSTRRTATGTRRECPSRYDLYPTRGPSTGSVIAVGRLGAGIEKDGNPADAALLAMVDAARTSVKLSLQDLGPMKAPLVNVPVAGWPDGLLASIGAALVRGVDVYLVLSNEGAVAGGLPPAEASYNNGWSVGDVIGKVREAMTKLPAAPRGAELDALLCTKLHAAPFRHPGAEAWSTGTPFASHAKTLIVDDQAFYIGSQNLYTASLQEFGYIVDDSLVAQRYLAGYWDQVWSASSRRALVGNANNRCVLQ